MEGIVIRKTIKLRYRILTAIIIIFILVDVFLYYLATIITPYILAVADAEIKARILNVINETIIKECSERFNYDEVMRVERDRDNNIVMLRADTMKMNVLSSNITFKVQQRLDNFRQLKIDIPMGYIFNNNLLAQLGPNIRVEVEPLGYIETKYLSQFESVGINQSRHKIYVELNTKVKVIVPLKSNEIDLKTQVAVSETILLGKVPENLLNMDWSNTGYKTTK